MYDELVKRLRDYEESGLSPISPYEAGDVADAIEELSRFKEDCDACGIKTRSVIESLQKKIPRWIPVTERLPEKFENVLVANKRGKHYDIDKGWWNGSFFDRCAKGSYSNVTHWMPLPQPPKEGET